MQLKISGHHLQLTPAIENYLMRRLQKIERHHDPIVNGQVTLSVDKERQQAEGRIHFSGFDLFNQQTEICTRGLMRWWTSWIARSSRKREKQLLEDIDDSD